MTFLKFDDNRITRAFNRIAKLENDSNKIDSAQEKEALAALISGVSHQISRHDLALLKSGSLSFDDKEVKNYFKNTIDKNGNRKIDTKPEYDEIKAYLDKKADNLNNNDKTLLQNMMDSYEKETRVVVNVKGNNNNVQLIIGDNNQTTINELPEVEKQDNVIETVEEQQIVEIDNKKETSIKKPKPYKIQKGDYWYKMVTKNYNVTAETDIKEIVRKFKDEYFNTHKEQLIKQGYTSSKSGFFLKTGEVFNLPQEVEISGKTITLK